MLISYFLFRFKLPKNNTNTFAVVYIKFGEWDVRRSVVTGQLNRAMRYIDKMLDDGYRAVVKLQEQGKNATQYVLVRKHYKSFLDRQLDRQKR